VWAKIAPDFVARLATACNELAEVAVPDCGLLFLVNDYQLGVFQML